MTDPVDTFAIDPEELLDVIREIVRCSTSLDELTTDLDRQVATLHQTWEGLAAVAQKEAHEEWSKGMRAVHKALVELGEAGRLAHANYTGAADTNLAMWQTAR